MAYGASIFTILLLGAGAIYINTVFFHNFPVLQFAIVAALALTAVAIFEPIRKFIQTPLEEKWITGWYDPTKVMSRIAERLVPVLERDEAFRIVDVSLRQTFRHFDVCQNVNASTLSGLKTFYGTSLAPHSHLKHILPKINCNFSCFWGDKEVE
jgi:hypothetical protein